MTPTIAMCSSGHGTAAKREVEQIVAALRPRPDVPATVRKVPDRRVAPMLELTADRSPTASSSPTVLKPVAAPVPSVSRPAVVRPLAPERYKLQLTISRATHEKLRRARDLRRHAVSSGDFAAILDRALDLLLADLERTKMAAASRPRAQRKRHGSSRCIPAAVRRAVWKRDAGRCAFKGTAYMVWDCHYGV